MRPSRTTDPAVRFTRRRAEFTAFAAFVRDPDGHRLEAVTHVPTKPLMLDEGAAEPS